ncbi:hypothetical protein Cadr_000010051 [Camelus dromedarius]|uniref:Uncharacterized protein n=1 Tax=Camelus dromedarius TaxID=9838 RepID=A0A5N4DXN3_CAMDR|nr:hypothetical protein Cadr_000010051 [Camelus dromedarius]
MLTIHWTAPPPLPCSEPPGITLPRSSHALVLLAQVPLHLLGPELPYVQSLGPRIPEGWATAGRISPTVRANSLKSPPNTYLRESGRNSGLTKGRGVTCLPTDSSEDVLHVINHGITSALLITPHGCVITALLAALQGCTGSHCAPADQSSCFQ